MNNEFSMEEKIDILIETVAELKESVNQRFDQVDRSFDDVHQRLDHHEHWLKRIDKNLGICVTKPQFNKLLGVLEDKQTISKFDSLRIKQVEPLA